MNARAQAKHVRQSPYKVRRVLDLVVEQLDPGDLGEQLTRKKG